jgi:hypothetical protein
VVFVVWYLLHLCYAGKKTLSPQLFYQVSMDELEPEDNFYRQLGKALDLGYLYGIPPVWYGAR